MPLSIFTISKTEKVYQYSRCCSIHYFPGMTRSPTTALGVCHLGDGKQSHQGTHLVITNFTSQAPKKN